MAYRSFTPLATRKSPAFRGKSLELDGVSDFIDLQGEYCGAIRQAAFSCIQGPNVFVENTPMSWSFWVKFPASTISDVILNHVLGGDMKHFILKTHAANGAPNPTSLGNDSENGYWSGPFLGLVGTLSDGVRVGIGYGNMHFGQGITKRKIHRSQTTEIVADTWYNIVATWYGFNDINLYIDGVDETSGGAFVDHIPNGSGGAGGIQYHFPNSYDIPFAPNVNHGSGHTQGEVDAYLAEEPEFAAYIGRNQSDYLAMTIHDAVFWGNTALDVNDAIGISSRQNIDQIQYHVNTSDYDKALDIHAIVDNLDFTGQSNKPTNETITLTDIAGNVYVFKFIGGGQTNGALQADGSYAVIYTGNNGSDMDNLTCCGNFVAAINLVCKIGEFNIIEAADNSGSLDITQGYGGASGNTPIAYSNTFGSDYVRSDGGAAPVKFTGGVDRLHAVWKFRGKRSDTSLDSRLQSTDNRVSEYHEEDFGRALTSQTLSGRRTLSYPVWSSTQNLVWFVAFDECESDTLPALNNGGTWVSDIPPDTI